ncbi:hypothetical protein HPG69_005107, partial [Diceros bicornis minor]
ELVTKSSLHQEVPARFNFASDVVDHWSGMEKAGKQPPSPALWWVSSDGDEMMRNFSQLRELSQQVADVLLGACGLQRGDHVAVMKAKDVLYRAQVSKARAIMAGDKVAQAVDTVAPDCPSLKTKLLVSEKSWNGWLDLKTLLC